MSGIIRSRRREAKALPRGSLLRRVAAPALAVLAGLWAPAASADILLWSANSNLPQDFTYPNTGFVDLNGTAAGGASLTFATTQANQRVIIFFNATCVVSGEAGAFADVDIFVDPAGTTAELFAPPTGAVLCQDLSSSRESERVSAARVASVRLPQAGNP
jgi:hypothetical protein